MRKIPFFNDLKRPFYPQAVKWHKNVRSGRGEFKITSDWTIISTRGASQQVKLAARDLQSFLAEANVQVKIHFSNVEPITSNFILLRKISQVGQVPESYTIRTKPGQIVIEAADDSGLMYGVFELEEQMKFRASPIVKNGVLRRKPILSTRILRSPMSCFHRREVSTILGAYPKNYLLKMAHHGYNGIWLHGKLNEMAKVSVFPEFGRNADGMVKDLNILVRRAANYGIRVYLYFNEPLGIPQASDFWKKYPHLMGQPHEGEGVFSLCTSTPQVQTFLREGMQYLFSQVSGLAGVILITASEFQSHCFSHLNTRGRRPAQWRKEMFCDRCRQRTPQKVIGEVVSCICHGVHAAAPTAQVIVWNWSWMLYEDEPQESVIKSLPPKVIIMADFERGGKRITNGHPHVVDEYSLCYVGPSERFKGASAAARRLRHQVFAKLQIGVTHEIATVPHFPVYHKFAEKFIQIKKNRVGGAMSCWNFGNILSLKTELANRFSWAPQPRSVESELKRMAVRDFGEKAAPDFVAAWRIFSRACDHYPFSVPLLYWGPQHFGPAYPLFFRKVGRHMPIPWLLPSQVKYDTCIEWMKYTEFGDQIMNYVDWSTPEAFISCFDRMVGQWVRGVERVRTAMQDVPLRLRPNARREYTVCAAVMSQFSTVRNVTQFTHLRNCYYEERSPRKQRTLLRRMIIIAEDENRNSTFCKRLAKNNNMLGFHGEAFGYCYNPAKIDVKIASVKKVIRQMRGELGKS